MASHSSSCKRWCYQLKGFNMPKQVKLVVDSYQPRFASDVLTCRWSGIFHEQWIYGLESSVHLCQWQWCVGFKVPPLRDTSWISSWSWHPSQDPTSHGQKFFGVHRKNQVGRELAGGYRGCYWGFRCDGKARKECNMFQRSYMHSLICEACLAQRPHKDWQPLLNYKNFYPSAAHRLTIISLAPSCSTNSKIDSWNVE